MSSSRKKIILQLINDKGETEKQCEVEKPEKYQQFKKIIFEKLNISFKCKIIIGCHNPPSKELKIIKEFNYQETPVDRKYKIKTKKIEEKERLADEMSIGFICDSLDLDQTELMEQIRDKFKCYLCLELVKKPLMCSYCKRLICEKCLSNIKPIKNNKLKQCGFCRKELKKNEWIKINYLNDVTIFLKEFAKKSAKENDLINKLEQKVKDYEEKMKTVNNTKKCEKHPYDLVLHFCYDCQKEYCGTCLFIDEKDKHIGHKIMSNNDYKKIHDKIDFTKNIEKINVYISKCDLYTTTIKEGKEFFIKFIDKLKEILVNRTEGFINEIKEIKDKLENNKNELKNLELKMQQYFNLLDNENYNNLSGNKAIQELFKNINNNIIQRNELNKYNMNYFSILKNNEILKWEPKLFFEYSHLFIDSYSKLINIIFNTDSNKKTKILSYIIKNNDNQTYQGYVNEDGLKDGYGTLTSKDGTKYSGQWKKDTQFGYGVSSYEEGDKYEGFFKDNNRDGYGKYYFANGNVYIGEFKKDVIDGLGIFHTKNGNKYIGEWKNNSFDGHGVFFYNDGAKFEGNYKKDEREGIGTMFYSNGDIEIGKYSKDNKVGTHTILYLNGEIKKEKN